MFVMEVNMVVPWMLICVVEGDYVRYRSRCVLLEADMCHEKRICVLKGGRMP